MRPSNGRILRGAGIIALSINIFTKRRILLEYAAMTLQSEESHGECSKYNRTAAISIAPWDSSLRCRSAQNDIFPKFRVISRKAQAFLLP